MSKPDSPASATANASLSRQLDESVLQAALAEQCQYPWLLDLHQALPSTNRHLAEHADEHQPGRSVICVAGVQTAGVGRRGRTWQSGASSITLSVRHGFRLPPSELGGLSLVTGLVVAEAISAHCVQPIMLKWPNDLMVCDRKLAGILIELPRNTPESSLAVAGVGINYGRDPQHDKVDQPLITLAETSGTLGSREQLLCDVAAAMVNAFHRFEQDGWAAFSQRYAARNYLLGRSVTISQGSRQETGLALEIAESGGLVVEVEGVKKTLFSGEVSIRVAL